MNLKCPKCRTEIPLEDVNVSTDLALCRQCSQTYSFAELSQNREVLDVDFSRPPRGVWYRNQGNEFEVGSSTRSWAALFLVPFTLVWAGGSIGGIYGSQFIHHKFDLFQSLFGIPFLIGSVVLVSLTLMTVLGKLAVRGTGDHGSVFIGVGPFGWNRRFRWSEIRSVKMSLTKWQQNNRNLPVIELEGPTAIRFGSQLSEKRRNFIYAVLRQKAINA